MSRTLSPDGTQSFAPFIQWVLIPFIIVFLCIPYVQVEALTAFQPSFTADFEQMCLQQRLAQFKYVRILQLNQSNQTAKIFCAFKPRSHNILLDVEKKDGTWVTIYSQPAANNFAWPLYF